MRSIDYDYKIYVEWFKAFMYVHRKNRFARVQTFMRNRYTFRGEVKIHADMSSTMNSEELTGEFRLRDRKISTASRY